MEPYLMIKPEIAKQRWIISLFTCNKSRVLNNNFRLSSLLITKKHKDTRRSRYTSSSYQRKQQNRTNKLETDFDGNFQDVDAMLCGFICVVEIHRFWQQLEMEWIFLKRLKVWWQSQCFTYIDILFLIHKICFFSGQRQHYILRRVVSVSAF